MLIATVLLLTILVLLTIWGVKTQRDVMQKPYVLKDAQSIQMRGSKASDHIIIKEAQ